MSTHFWKPFRRRLLAALMILCLLLALAPAWAEPAEQPAAEEAAAGRTVFLPGDRAGQPVMDMDAAAAVVASLKQELAANEQTAFEPWRTLTDTAGNRYYVFQQMYAETTVSGGAVKVITDPAGTMLGLISSAEADLPDAALSEGISAEEAEAQVLAHEKERTQDDVEIMAGKTGKVILPVNRDLDPYFEEEKEESRFVWAVYTICKESSVARGSDLPFVAHYVAMDGTYLYSLPTLMPGDDVSVSGYSAAYIFQFMESVPYTGTVTLPDGTVQEITVDVMRDSRTGMYYLGNLERRIAVADCYSFIYENGTTLLVASPDNTGWDETCLASLYNYCRAWDYYNAIGWRGADGEETPILILKDYCDSSHTPINNAAYAGKYYGWQVFLSSSANQFSKALDVLAHEFTHCVTHSVMTYNAYMNDYGAINEAMSDIQGNICEQMAGATADDTWLLGETSGTLVRSMSDPHLFDQPEYAWDLYYQPQVRIPTAINDRGGVHTNSSLLNQIAWKLCAEGGMTMEDARAFWFAVDCTMVPGTDYAQLATLMPWVMTNLGMDGYRFALERAITETAIHDNRLPETIAADRTLLRLTLPDQEIFTDGNWMLSVYTLDVEAFKQRFHDVLNGENGYESALPELVEAFQPKQDEPEQAPEEKKGFFERLLDLFSRDDKEEQAPEETPPAGNEEAESALERVRLWYNKYFGDIIFTSNASAGQDGRTVQMMVQTGYALPLLMQCKIKPGLMEPETLDYAVYVLGRWVDLGSLIQLSTEYARLSEEAGEEEQQKVIEGLDIQGLLEQLLGPGDQEFSLKSLADRVFVRFEGGKVCELSAQGLENVQLFDPSVMTAPSSEPEE